MSSQSNKSAPQSPRDLKQIDFSSKKKEQEATSLSSHNKEYTSVDLRRPEDSFPLDSVLVLGLCDSEHPLVFDEGGYQEDIPSGLSFSSLLPPPPAAHSLPELALMHESDVDTLFELSAVDVSFSVIPIEDSSSMTPDCPMLSSFGADLLSDAREESKDILVSLVEEEETLTFSRELVSLERILELLPRDLENVFVPEVNEVNFEVDPAFSKMESPTLQLDFSKSLEPVSLRIPSLHLCFGMMHKSSSHK